MSDRAPAYRGHVLHYKVRLVALCKGDRNEETPATKNKQEMLMRRACARTLSPRNYLLLEGNLQPTPSPLCGLASGPLLGACSMYPGEQLLAELESPARSELNPHAPGDVKYPGIPTRNEASILKTTWQFSERHVVYKR
jgi:hypothetical protein